MPQDATPRNEFNIKLRSPDDLPVGDALTFSMKSAQPFPRGGKIEIASPDDSLHTTLSLMDPNGALILESPDTLLATLQPLKAFGTSAFGPIRMRAVAPDGTAGDWAPLVTLVRLPTFTRLSCPVSTPTPPASRKPKTPPASADATASVAADGSPAPDADSATPPTDAAQLALATAAAAAPPQPAASDAPPSPAATCTLSGTGLYFLDGIATDESYTNPTRVPEGFVGVSLAVPPPTGAVYYLRLRDDPANVGTLTLPAGPL